MSSIAAVSMAGRPRLRRLAWRHPEWWALALCAAAWLVMLRPQGGHHLHHAQAGGIASRLGGWMLMTAAMMLPLVVGSIRYAAERSLWRRRHRAIAGFLLGFLACWMVPGALIAFVTPGSVAAAIAFAAAAAWQLTRRKRLALAACHRVMPLAPRGWRADRDCVRYGWRSGAQCVLSCWAAMAACALAGHHPAAMIGLFAIACTERFTRRPDHRLLSAALAAAAVICIV